MSDDFNDGVIDVQWRVVNPSGSSGVIQEANGRVEVGFPANPTVTYQPVGLKQRFDIDITDIDAKLDVSIDSNVRIVTLLIGADQLTAKDNPAYWAQNHYRITYWRDPNSGLHYVTIVRREGATDTFPYGVQQPFFPYFQLRIRISGNTIFFYLNGILLHTEDATWLITATGGLGIVEFTTQSGDTAGTTPAQLTVFDNYITKPASTPEPTLQTLTLPEVLNVITEPPAGQWQYPSGWQVSVFANIAIGETLEKWLVNGGEMPSDNPLILSLTADVAVTPVLAVPMEPPVASFVASATSVLVGDPVTFDASQSFDPDGAITNYAWNFGDNTIGSGVAVNHSWALEGTYLVTLTVTDNDGLSSSANTTITVSVVPPPPSLCPAAVIATCVYGPSLELNVLRRFRDNFMARNVFGCFLARTYYRIGKYIAAWLRDKTYTQRVLKGYLDLLVTAIRGGELDKPTITC